MPIDLFEKYNIDFKKKEPIDLFETYGIDYKKPENIEEEKYYKWITKHPKEAIKSEITSAKKQLLSRPGEVFKEELTGGLETIKQAFAEPSLKSLYQVPLGTIRTGFSPFTAFTKSYVAEPVETIARQGLGLSESISKSIGQTAEAGIYFIPMLKALQSAGIISRVPALETAEKVGLDTAGLQRILREASAGRKIVSQPTLKALPLPELPEGVKAVGKEFIMRERPPEGFVKGLSPEEANFIIGRKRMANLQEIKNFINKHIPEELPIKTAEKLRLAIPTTKALPQAEMFITRRLPMPENIKAVGEGFIAKERPELAISTTKALPLGESSFTRKLPKPEDIIGVGEDFIIKEKPIQKITEESIQKSISKEGQKLIDEYRKINKIKTNKKIPSNKFVKLSDRQLAIKKKLAGLYGKKIAEDLLKPLKEEAGAIKLPSFEEIKRFFVPETPERLQQRLTENYIKDATVKTQKVSNVDDIVNTLKSVKLTRKQQNIINMQEYAKRFAKVKKITEQKQGLEWLKTAKGAMKGEFEKADFQPILDKFTPERIDELINMIKDHPVLTEGQKLNVAENFVNMLHGKIPQPKSLKLMETVFGKELPQAILANRDVFSKMKDMGIEIANLPRTLMSSYDISAPFRQGVFLVRRPEFWKNIPLIFKNLKSDKIYQATIESIMKSKNYPLMEKHKLALTDIGAGFTEAEEKFMSNLATKIPIIGKGVKASNRAYVGFLNKLRSDVFNQFVKQVDRLGVDEVERDLLLDAAAKYVNNATGRGSFGKNWDRAAILLNSTFFSPRLFASRVNLLNPITYVKMPAPIRREALKDLMGFVGLGMTVLGLAKLAGAEVGADPRSADFGKIKVGKTRFDIWGGFQQYIKFLAQILNGKLISSVTGKEYTLGEGYKPLTRLDIAGRFLEYKTAPIASLALELLRGKTFLGEDLDIHNTILRRFTPMFIEDLNALTQEEGGIGVLKALPGAVGVGVQHYGLPRYKYKYNPNTGKLEKSPTYPPSFSENVERLIRGWEGNEKQSNPLPPAI